MPTRYAPVSSGRGFDAGSVPGRDAGREFGAGDAAAPGAGESVGSVLDDVGADGREFEFDKLQPDSVADLEALEMD